MARTKKLAKVTKETMTLAMRQAQKYAKKAVSGGGNSKTRLNVRSGRLRSSIAVKISTNGLRTVGTIGTNVIYARTHEYGATIKPVKAKALTIPTGYLRGKLGSGAVQQRARDFKDTFIMQGYGNAIIAQKTGKTSKSIKPLFILKNKVKIPKRPFLEPSLERVVPFVTERIEKYAGGK